MKKIVFAIIIGITANIHGQIVQYIPRYDYEKKGEYRVNRDGGIDYYEKIDTSASTKSSYDTSYLNLLTHLAQVERERAMVRYQYYSTLYQQSLTLTSEANKAFNDKKYATAGNKYVEAYNLLVNIPNEYDTNAEKGFLYASWLESMYYNKDYTRFLEKYNYDKIKYSKDQKLNNKLWKFYKDLTGDSIREEAYNFYHNGNYTQAIQKYKEAYTYQKDKLKGVLNENSRLQKMADNYIGYLVGLYLLERFEDFLSEYNYNIIKYSSYNNEVIYVQQAYNYSSIKKKEKDIENYINTKNYANAEYNLWERYLYFNRLNDIKGKEKKKFLLFNLTNNQNIIYVRDNMSRSYINYLYMLLAQNKTTSFLKMYDKNKLKYITEVEHLENIEKLYKEIKKNKK